MALGALARGLLDTESGPGLAFRVRSCEAVYSSGWDCASGGAAILQACHASRCPFPGRTSGSPQRRPLIRAEGDTESETESAAGHADGPSDGPQHVSRTQSGGFSRAHDPIQCTFPHVPMCIRGHPEDVTSPVTRRRARGTDSPPLA